MSGGTALMREASGIHALVAILLVALGVGASMPVCALLISARAAPSGTIEIAAQGGYFVGGERVRVSGAAPRLRVGVAGPAAPLTDLNGDYQKGATYVGYTRLARPRMPYPLVMVPGGGLSGASFEDTPDGRPGWQSWFLAHGYSVSLVDIDATGRSPWRPFPEISNEEPSFRSNAFLWETFRIGPPGSYARRQAYPDSAFPTGAFDNLAKQAAPRFHPDPASQAAAYDAVIKKACPCILLLHSAAGKPGLAAAQRWPSLVKAVVAIEPSAAPETRGSASLAPTIFVWGDHLGANETDPDWSREYSAARAYAAVLRSARVPVTWIDLPAHGLRGNSHLMMMDRNSDEVAALIDDAVSEALHSDGRSR